MARVPRLNLLELSVYVADLVLVSEGSREAIRQPKVRAAWHLFFFSALIANIITVGFTVTARPLLAHSLLAAVLYRGFFVAASSYLLVLCGLLAYRHYMYLLRTGRDTRFLNIVWFFVLAHMLFAMLYRSSFLLHSKLFTYPNPILAPSSYLVEPGFGVFLLFLDFLVYSCCTMVTLPYPRIQSNSFLISALNVVEVLCGVCLVAVFVATFVQKVSRKGD